MDNSIIHKVEIKRERGDDFDFIETLHEIKNLLSTVKYIFAINHL